MKYKLNFQQLCKIKINNQNKSLYEDNETEM